MKDGSLIALVALGAFHGLNPGMGWLFAVARGLQERSRALVLQALPAIAAGHAASVFVVAVVVTLTGSVLTSRVVSIAGGVVLVGFGLWRLLSARHFRWVGMRLTLWQLAGWSFLMSSAHGAGLMLLPVLAAGSAGAITHDHMPGMLSGAGARGTPAAALGGLAAAGVHTIAMFTVMATCAVLAYEFVGVNILRRAWFNMDKVWAGVMVAAGALTIALTA
jgi:hypothetical protein